MFLLLACAPPPDFDIGSSGDDTGTTPSPPQYTASRCGFDPPVEEIGTTLRVDGAGGLWVLESGGRLLRFERTAAGGCAFEGFAVNDVETGTFEAVSDVEVDASGRVWELVFFTEVRELDTSGMTLRSCEVDPGHAIAAGSRRVYVWPVGAEELAVVDVDGGNCVDTKETLALEHPVSVPGAVVSAGFVADSFDPSAELAPGYVFDLDDGRVLTELAPDHDELHSFVDIVGAGEGFVAVDGSDFWRLNANGAVTARISGEDLFGEGAWWSPQSVAEAGDGYYVSANVEDGDGVWWVGLQTP